MTWKNTETTTDVFKETSSIRKKAVEIESVFNLLSDGPVRRNYSSKQNWVLTKLLWLL